MEQQKEKVSITVDYILQFNQIKQDKKKEEENYCFANIQDLDFEFNEESSSESKSDLESKRMKIEQDILKEVSRVE
eukprot:CAMPEP_0170559798 /NCGR_PEP_ID=MMETSP0211-20121228/45030_1 /TAXON_ID=311385 /ORGANISM="Pseudokeronopsis sp., Strain OXSARD2" /LENGTH=75 /DNA_ID=CAMNT_0010873261 /DNA_START=1324 /DNA_END=1548 /DNA_ORIENTATION=+